MGAFDFGLYRLTWPRMGKLPKNPTMDDFRKNWAIKSFQEELSAKGYRNVSVNGIYDWHTASAVKAFQKSRGLKADGQIGSLTSKKIFTKIMNDLTIQYELPPKILCGLVTQESGFDPAAVGFLNPSDRGLLQINSVSHPEISDEFAFTAQSALNWGTQRLAASYEYFSKKTTDTVLAWKCAIANHNSPGDAKAWVLTGTPPDEQIQTYVEKVLSHCGAELG